MSLDQAGMLAEADAVGAVRGSWFGGPSASRYFLMVLRWIPNSRSISRSDIPLHLAFWIAFHLSICRNVGLRAEVALGSSAAAELLLLSP